MSFKEEDIEDVYKLKTSKESLDNLLVELDKWDADQIARAQLVIELADGGIRQSVKMPFDKDDFAALAATKKTEINSELEAKGVTLKVEPDPIVEPEQLPK